MLSIELRSLSTNGTTLIAAVLISIECAKRPSALGVATFAWYEYALERIYWFDFIFHGSYPLRSSFVPAFRVNCPEELNTTSPVIAPPPQNVVPDHAP
jgi:hypothetical protein